MSLTQKVINWKFTFARVLLFCLCCALTLILISPLSKKLTKPWSEITIGIVASIIVFALTILFARWEKIQLKELGVIPNQRTLGKFTAGFGIGIFVAFLHVILVLIFSNSQLVLSKDISIRPVLIMFSLYLVLALREELAFRGFPLRSLNRAIGSWKAQIIIALIFALEHLAGGYTFVQAFAGAGLGAILFGIAALASKGIAMPVGIHLAWNFGQWCAGYKNEPGIWQNIIETGSESSYEHITMAIYVLVMSIAIVAFYLYGKKREVL